MNYKFGFFLCILLVVSTGCLQFIPDDIMGNEGDVNMNVELEIEDGYVEIIDYGEVETIYLRDGDSEKVLEEGEEEEVDDGDLIVGEINGEEDLIERVELSEEDETDNGSGTDDDSRGASTFNGDVGGEVDNDEDVFIVDEMGGGDYRSIQQAIDEAPYSSKIIVNPGIYREQLEVEKKVDIIGLEGASLVGGEEYESAITVNNAEVEINGLSIDSYDQAVDIEDNYKSVELDSLFISNVDEGVNIKNNYGDVTITNSKISNFVFQGVYITDNYGHFTLENIYFSDSSGIGLNVLQDYGTSGTEYLSFNDIDNSVYLSTTSDVKLENSWVPSYERDVNSCSSPDCGSNVNSEVYLSGMLSENEIEDIERNQVHMVSSNIQSEIDSAEEGDIIVITSGIDGFSLDKNITVTSFETETVSGDNEDKSCITIEDEANPTIHNLEMEGCSSGITDENAGDWILKDSIIQAEYQAISAVRSSGDWQIWDSQIIDSKYGIYAPSSEGNWAVINSNILDHSNSALMVSGDSGDGRVHFSQITGNEYDVQAISEGGSRVNLQHNWWGNSLIVTSGSSANTNRGCNSQNCEREKQNFYNEIFSDIT